jgi:hypothetical protein
LPAPKMRRTMTSMMIISGNPRPNIVNHITFKRREQTFFYCRAHVAPSTGKTGWSHPLSPAAQAEGQQHASGSLAFLAIHCVRILTRFSEK